MKMKIILIIIVLIILITIIFFASTKKESSIKDIQNFHFSYTTGNYMNAYVIYDLNHENNKYIVTIKPNNIDNEQAKKIEVDKNTVNKITKTLNKYNVEKWNNFNKSDKHVLDGNSFSLSLKTKNCKVSANGYMKWPKNYTEVKQELDKIFDKIYKQKN